MGHIVRSTGRVLPPLVADARAQAETLRAAVEAEREAARAAGHAEGRAQALAEAAQLLAAARAELDRARRSAGSTALLLARRMAERILGRALALDPAAAPDIVAAALEAARAGDGEVVVRVAASELATIEAARPRLLARLPAVEMRLEPDPSLAVGDCIVETRHGRLDARVSTQLDALERALGRSLDGESS